MSTEIITDLNSLCSNCGFYDNYSVVNNGYGCTHKETREYEYINARGKCLQHEDYVLAESFTKRNIRCSKRLAKKFLKKARLLKGDERRKAIEQTGYKFYGKCFSFSCPISYEVSFDSISHYENAKEYDYIESEEEMPWGFGDDLMALEKTEADKLGITY